MAFPVFLDTCTIFGAGLSNLLLTLAEQGTYRPLWSQGVLDELRRNLEKVGIVSSAIDYRISCMNESFPDALVSGYQGLMPNLHCDPKDQHVLAAAIWGNAAIIVTFDLRDFPPDALEQHNIRAVHPDEFLLDQLDLYPSAVQEAVTLVPARYESPPVTVDEFLDLLHRSGVPRFVQMIRTVL